MASRTIATQLAILPANRRSATTFSGRRCLSIPSFVTLLLFASVQSSMAATNTLGILVPAYFQSSSEWARLDTAARQVPIAAILNPNSGPGTQKNATYLKLSQSLKKSGGRIIGYVSTRYAQRPSAEVEMEIAQYYQWYPVDGIFVDEMSNDLNESSLTYFSNLNRKIHELHREAWVVGNPGIHLPAKYHTSSTADTWVTFEVDQGYENYRSDAWTFRYPTRQFAHLIYNIPDAKTMTNDVRLANQRHAGWVYVTDDQGANPWDRLPNYWNALVNQVERHNLSVKPEARLRIDSRNRNEFFVSAEAAPGLWKVEASSNLGQWNSKRELYFGEDRLYWTDSFENSSPISFLRLRR